MTNHDLDRDVPKQPRRDTRPLLMIFALMFAAFVVARMGVDVAAQTGASRFVLDLSQVVLALAAGLYGLRASERGPLVPAGSAILFGLAVATGWLAVAAAHLL